VTYRHRGCVDVRLYMSSHTDEEYTRAPALCGIVVVLAACHRPVPEDHSSHMASMGTAAGSLAQDPSLPASNGASAARVAASPRHIPSEEDTRHSAATKLPRGGGQPKATEFRTRRSGSPTILQARSAISFPSRRRCAVCRPRDS